MMRPGAPGREIEPLTVVEHSERSALHRVVFGTPETIAGTVYGTIVVMGAITAGAHASGDPWRLAVIVAGTVLVLWIAHVYSHALGESIALGRRLDEAEFLSVARREFAIPLAAVAPIGALALGALGVMKEATSIWVAVLIGLATLTVQGFRYAGLEHLGRAATAVSVALNLALGLVIVALKVLVAH
jgi:hypothetical protein